MSSSFCRYSQRTRCPESRWTPLSTSRCVGTGLWRERECVCRYLASLSSFLSLSPRQSIKIRGSINLFDGVVIYSVYGTRRLVGTTQSVPLCFFLSVSQSISFRERPTMKTTTRPGKWLTMNINSAPKLFIMRAAVAELQEAVCYRLKIPSTEKGKKQAQANSLIFSRVSY